MTRTVRSFAFRRSVPGGGTSAHERSLAVERPVAVEVDGMGYAVLMATPADLSDLAHGFALSERLIDPDDRLAEVDVHQGDGGTVVRIALPRHRHDRIANRVRHRASDASCGLCGIENIEQAMRPLPPVTATARATDDAVFRAAAALRDHQPLAHATGAVHAAALCDRDGTIVMVREDVGRHNAFDKLIGAMRCSGTGWDGGFALLSSRCSYELVEKAVLAGCPMLATVSAATALAVERAAGAGLALRTLVRADALLAS